MKLHETKSRIQGGGGEGEKEEEEVGSRDSLKESSYRGSSSFGNGVTSLRHL